MALNTLRLGDPLREMIDEVAAAAARAGDLTRQLLAFSRKQIVEPKVVDLSVLLENMHSMLARLLGEDIDLQIHARRDIGCVRADPSHLEQVVLNLAINGRDAMPDGGKLVIETDAIVLDEDYCAVHPNAKEGPYVLLAVRDGGMGMDAETQEKIFEPFFTTKQQGQGTGLGLATVLGIVEQNGGRIDVISEAGQGTTFRVYFPRVAEDPKDAKEKERSTFAEGGETVLVVEDEKMVRNLAVRLLESCGYEVWAAASGPDALALAERRAGRVDLLLTDVVMPQMNGRQLADTLSKKYPQLKILYTSGYTDDVIAHHGLLDEGVRFIAKPYSRHALATKVRETLDDEPPSGRK
jgi:CheY-like chemotaxis protein